MVERGVSSPVMKRFFPATIACAMGALAFASAEEKEKKLEEPAKAAVPSFQVKVTGSGKPLLLIPGLGSSGAVWDTTVARLEKRHACHVLTLAGFAGEPPSPAADPFLETVRKELAAYIREKKLEKPIVMGHSLGAFIALSLAAHEPELPGKVIAVDGVPFYPALFDHRVTAEASRANAEELQKQMDIPRPRERRMADAKTVFQSMITKEKDIELPLRWFVDSDAATLSKAVCELMTTDLREKAASIKAPVLLLASVAIAPDPDQLTTMKAAYRRQVENVPEVKVSFTEKAKHFIMLDDPEWFFGEVEKFLEPEKRDERDP